MRRLYLSLKDKNNKELRESVVSGDITVVKFCKMSVQVGLGKHMYSSYTPILTYAVLGNETETAPAG